jgi:hypothetical protein
VVKEAALGCTGEGGSHTPKSRQLWESSSTQLDKLQALLPPSPASDLATKFAGQLPHQETRVEDLAHPHWDLHYMHARGPPQ